MAHKLTVLIFVILIGTGACAREGPVRCKAEKDDKLIGPIYRQFIALGYKVFYEKKKSEAEGWVVDGKVEVYDQNDCKLMEVSCRNGQADGWTISWHKNGKTCAKTFYKDGRENGVSTYWDEVGNKIRELSYIDGEKDGKEVCYDKRGAVHLVCDWQKGKPQKVEFYKDGKMEKTLIGKDAERYVIGVSQKTIKDKF